MAYNIETSNLATRESRIGSITGYIGSMSDLIEQTKCGTLKGCDRCFSQSSMCLAGCALAQLGTLRDVAVIHDGPSGCSATSVGEYVLTKQVADRDGLVNHAVYVGTDLNEKDTIFGSAESLKDITVEIYHRYHPKALFVSSSCTTGIIGVDIDSVVDELRQEITDVPVIAVHCEGFKSRMWASGMDIAGHAILQLVKPPKERTNRINIINFYGSLKKEITEMFHSFDLDPVFLYANASIEELETLSEAICTCATCGTVSQYLANGLEELYGVPFSRTINPCGVEGFETWLRGIAKITHREEVVEAYIAEQRALYMPQIEDIKKELQGLHAVIGMGPGYTFEVSRVLAELGIQIDWALAWHYDKQYDNGEIPPSVQFLDEHKIDFEASVADQQNYEVMNILNHFKPDVYFSRHPGTAVWAMKQGVASVFVADEYMIYGHKRTLEFAQTILNTIRNRSFERNLAKRTSVPYTDWWYEQKVDTFFEEGKDNGKNNRQAAV